MKKILAILLAALLACTLMSCKKDKVDTEDDDDKAVAELVYENFTYAVNGEGTYEITGYTYGGVELKDVVVPSKMPDGREVTGIAADAFKAIRTIKSVTIPATITYIGQYAFYDCDEITEIVIPDTVTSVGIGAFQDCDKLASVTLSKELKAVADHVFKNCVALDNIVLPEKVESIGDSSFWGCTSLTEIVIPEGVKDMGDATFYGCEALDKVTVLGTALGATEEDAEGNKTEHSIGEIVFHACAEDLVIKVTKDSAFAKYAEDNKYSVSYNEEVAE